LFQGNNVQSLEGRVLKVMEGEHLMVAVPLVVVLEVNLVGQGARMVEGVLKVVELLSSTQTHGFS
jgi:hypothetical protein